MPTQDAAYAEAIQMAGAVVNGLEPQHVMPSETNARLVKCHVLETRMIDANFGNMSAETVARADMSHMLGHASAHQHMACVCWLQRMLTYLICWNTQVHVSIRLVSAGFSVC